MSSSREVSEALTDGVPWTQPNGVKATYNLHCHCGTIKYRMTISPPLYAEDTQGKEQCVAVECNCSYCERNGYIAVHPLAEEVEFTQGLEHRVEYYTAAKTSPHWFCAKCGSVLGTDISKMMKEMFNMPPRYSINLRMLKDYDSARFKARPVQLMKDFGPKYEV